MWGVSFILISSFVMVQFLPLRQHKFTMVLVVLSGVSSDVHVVRFWILSALHASSQAFGKTCNPDLRGIPS